MGVGARAVGREQAPEEGHVIRDVLNRARVALPQFRDQVRDELHALDELRGLVDDVIADRLPDTHDGIPDAEHVDDGDGWREVGPGVFVR